MRISELIEYLLKIEEQYGDIDICLACQNWDAYVVLSENYLQVNSHIYAIDDNQDIAPGYEEGKSAIVIGLLN